MMVEFFSAEIEFSVCEKKEALNVVKILMQKTKLTWRYLNCSADEDSAITSDASLSALEAFCSPSAAMT